MSDAIDKYRRTNQQLKGQVAQLRKRIRLLEEEMERVRELADGIVDAPQQEQVKQMKDTLLICPDCGSHITIIPMGPNSTATLRLCTGCGKRTRRG